MDVNMCRLPDEIRIMPKFLVPLADIMWHPYFDGQYQYSVKHGKDCFYPKKKNGLLRTVAFHHLKIKCAANALKLFYQEILSPFRKHLCNQ